MIPAFIITGSMIIPATWPGCWSSRRLTLSRSLNVATRVSRVIASGMPVLAGTWAGSSAGPTSSASGATETWTESWWPW